MRAEKQFLLDEIKEKIDGSNGFVVTRYKGFTANKSREFRDLVQGQEGEFEVVRKRVFLKALEKSGVTLKLDEMEGHIGVIFSRKDTAALTKLAVKYGEANEKALEILGGKIENEIYSASDMVAISSLPGINELRAAFLGVVEAPLRDVVSVVNAHLTGLLYCLEQKAKQKES